MKSSRITHYIEIPIEVHFTAYPEERQTMTYPGCPAHIEIDQIQIPDEEAIAKIVAGETDSINEACLEEVSE